MQIFDRPEKPPRRMRRVRVPRLSRPRIHRLGLRAPRVLRRPLAWLVVAETAVCIGLVGAAWHLVATTAAATAPGTPLPAITSAPAPSGAPEAAGGTLAGGGAAAARRTVPAGHPGLGTGGAFLGGLLDGLNRDQADFENAEWSALQALSGAIRVYIENVMAPAVEKAERRGGRPR